MLSDILAAFLYAQLHEVDKIQEKRKNIWNYYYQHLETWAVENNIRLPIVPTHCEQAYHMFYLLMPSLKVRSHFINYLKEYEVVATFHYCPYTILIWGVNWVESSTIVQ